MWLLYGLNGVIILLNCDYYRNKSFFYCFLAKLDCLLLYIGQGYSCVLISILICFRVIFLFSFLATILFFPLNPPSLPPFHLNSWVEIGGYLTFAWKIFVEYFYCFKRCCKTKINKQKNNEMKSITEMMQKKKDKYKTKWKGSAV